MRCKLLFSFQDPVLRKRFKGKPEYVINYFFLLAEEVRQYMAKMGFSRFQDLVGRTDKLKFAPNPGNPKACLLNFDAMLKGADTEHPENNIGGSKPQNFELEKRLVSNSLCVCVCGNRPKEFNWNIQTPNIMYTFQCAMLTLE